MLIGLVRRIGTDDFDFGTDEDYHSGWLAKIRKFAEQQFEEETKGLRHF